MTVAPDVRNCKRLFIKQKRQTFRDEVPIVYIFTRGSMRYSYDCLRLGAT
jgi:hypothetical protein